MGAAALKAGHSNTIFTVRDIVDENGDVIQSYEFDPHGVPMPGSGASSGTFAPKTFHGALSVNDDTADSGLYLMGHRHWDPTLSRFISRDPIGFAGGLNLYGAAFGNNPMTFVDPWGLEAVYLLVTGPSPSNFQAGHTAAYLEGVGLFSLAAGSGGISPNDIGEMGSPGSDFTSYIADNAWRGVHVYRLELTDAQYEKLKKSFTERDPDCNNPVELGLYATGTTCAGSLDDMFIEAGIFPKRTKSKYWPKNLEARFKAAGGVYDANRSVPYPPQEPWVNSPAPTFTRPPASYRGEQF